MTADLVKFAKYSALLNEKDMNLLNAINFIDQTKREDAPTEERIEPTLSEEEVRTRKTRVVLNVFFALLLSLSSDLQVMWFIVYGCSLCRA